MDFLDPKKKQAHRIRLFIGYGLMSILVGIGATIMLFEASGFDVDRRTGAIIHNGLVFVDAHPEPAEVFLNGNHQGRTSTRLVIPEGTYELELKRDGYRPWKRKFNLAGSRIERFIYPFLFPENLQSEDSQLYAEHPYLATQSPDRKWLLVQKASSVHELEIVNLSAAVTETTFLTLDKELLTTTSGSQALELVEWSTNNRHVLLKHTHAEGHEFVLVDASAPQNSLNLNRHFTVPFTQVLLRDKRPDQFYLLNQSGGLLYRAESRSRQPVLLLEQVVAFKPHGSNVIMYITPEEAGDDRVAVKIFEGSRSYKLRELPADNRYLFDLARYDGRWYMAVGAPKDKRLFIYRDPLTALRRPARDLLSIPVPVAVLRAEEPQHLSLSATARFIALQDGSRMAVYDAETERSYRYDTKLELEQHSKITWMDGHRLVFVSRGKIVAMDYDGINKQELVAVRAGFQPFFDRDYDYMFTISPSLMVPERSALVRTNMRVPKQQP